MHLLHDMQLFRYTMQDLLLLLLASVAVVYVLLNRFLGGKHDAKEPPLVPQAIPFLGHAIGLLRKKMNYYVQLRQVSSLPLLPWVGY